MKPGQFNLLVIAALVSLLLAGVVHSAYNSFNDENVSGQRLFPNIADDTDQVAQITVQKGKDVFTFNRGQKGWGLGERGGYPVNLEKVRALMVRVARTELVEPKTSDPKKYKLLELEDPAKDGSKATLIRFKDTEGKTIAELVAGKAKIAAFGSGKSGTYVRKPGDPQTWLANLEIAALLDVDAWVDPVFVRLDPRKLTSLTLPQKTGDAIKLVPEDAVKEKFKFASVPDGKQLKSGVAASDMVTNLRTMELLDVRKAGSAKDEKADMVIPATVVMNSGMKVNFSMRRVKTDRWVTVDVADTGKDKAAGEKFRDRVNGWEFRVANWRADQVFRPLGEMFEDKPKPAPKPEAAKPKNEGGEAQKDATVKPVVPGTATQQ